MSIDNKPVLARAAQQQYEKVVINGIVQGVGFRPFVFRLAKQYGVSGWVANCGEGVEIYASFSDSQLDQMLTQISLQLPPLARIDSVKRISLIDSALENSDILPELKRSSGFFIAQSHSSLMSVGITADAATCSHCLHDITQPDNPRFGYAFTNCTHCGPRFSIANAIPYDRKNTSMDEFDQCPECLEEYQSPDNRRFHAQPNACPKCGPQLWLKDNNGNVVAQEAHSNDDKVIALAADLIKQGKIVAIKGIGGYQLALDAYNLSAIRMLRQRKKRPHKPLALMALSLECIAKFARLSDSDEQVLASPPAPIVLLPTKNNQVAREIAPNQSHVGVMLPNTPLHYMLLRHLGKEIVLTSANTLGEPQITDDSLAITKLSTIADYFLGHNRKIVSRVDDSVIKVVAKQPMFIRGGRGYAPQALPLPKGFATAHGVLALGADLKNSFCLLQNGNAVVSQYIGDLSNPVTQMDYGDQINHYCSLYQITPKTIAVDQHPDYVSSGYGQVLAQTHSSKLVSVQHHHAHIASVMAEHSLELNSPQVLGVALDGLGYGEDESIWGGEFLLADYRKYSHVGGFKPTPLLGGDKANKEPWRNLLSHLYVSGRWQELQWQFNHLPELRFLNSKPLDILTSMIDKGLNCSQSSSAGRLIDAVATLLIENFRTQANSTQSYEGQAASELEALAWQSWSDKMNSYSIGVYWQDEKLVVNWSDLWWPMLADLSRGVSASMLAARFHQTLIDTTARSVEELAKRFRFRSIVLSGGVFQNQLLTEGLNNQLKQYQVLLPRKLPANDGGLSLGQAVVAHATSGL